MDPIKIEKIQKDLAVTIEQYIKAIIEKYGKYMTRYVLKSLTDMDDYSKLIRIYDYGSINCYANSNEVNLPLCADKVLKLLNKIPGFGIDKSHMPYTGSTLINNNNTFLNYIIHVFISGTNTEQFFNDNLLHETMHLCGSGGASAIKEGINELLTRKIALEKNFRTSGCGYPKEVKIALLLQNALGEEVIDQIAFINSNPLIYEYLMENVGIDAAELYKTVSENMEKEFNEKYYSKINSFNGLTGIIKKITNYKRIDYSSIYQIIDDYMLKKNSNNQKK